MVSPTNHVREAHLPVWVSCKPLRTPHFQHDKTDLVEFHNPNTLFRGD